MNATELRVVDVMRIQARNTLVTFVQLINGEPRVGMKLARPDQPGRWEIVGFGASPPESFLSDPPSMTLSLLELEKGEDLSAGAQLREVA